MLKYSLLIIISFAPLTCYSQKILDDNYLKCQYQFIWQNDTLDSKTKEDLLILKIGKSMSKCISFYAKQVDSIMSRPNWYEIMRVKINKAMDSKTFMKGNYPHKRMKAYVYKNYPQGKMTVTDGISLQDYIYEDELHAQHWEFTDSTKTVLNYPCQMATCNFRGRHWTAWFTPDIPVSDGPWKFSGLPGLIMEVYDRNSQYHFTIVGVQKVKNDPIAFTETHGGNSKFEKTNRIDLLKAQKKYLMDMNGYIEMETRIDLSGGQPAKVMQYDLIERDY